MSNVEIDARPYKANFEKIEPPKYSDVMESPEYLIEYIRANEITE